MLNKQFALAWLVLATAVTVTACGGSDDNSVTAPTPVPTPTPAPGPSSASVVLSPLLPRTADPDVTPVGDISGVDGTAENLLAPPLAGVTAKNKLFVFLPGTDGTPDLYQYILQAGAAQGFHVIGLSYQSGPNPVGVICSTSSDPNCFFDVRNALINGGDDSPDITVSQPNAIVTRLTSTLTYLSTKSPADNWGQYLINGAVDWSKVVISGHSQGGGHAGLMAKQFAVARACYFASPPDWDTATNSPASWETSELPSLTAPSLQFGFSDTLDPSVPYSQLSVIWQALGMTNSADTSVNVDTTSSFSGQVLTTANPTPDNASDTTAGGTPLHGITIRDVYTPINATTGLPLYQPEWDYLCFQ